jgi:hypothetical protein
MYGVKNNGLIKARNEKNGGAKIRVYSTANL